MKIQLTKISTGEYKTKDNRFYILNTYSSAGCPGRANASKDLPWLVEDKSGVEPFYCSFNGKKSVDSFESLTEARSAIALVYKFEAEEKQVQEAGYIQEQNQEKPGRCWKSPKTGKLLVRSEALREIAL
jgi:hypothetical protein